MLVGSTGSLPAAWPSGPVVPLSAGRVRHARAGDLDELESVLERLRAIPGLTEKTRGVFYRRSRAYVHFHADPTGLFADLRVGDGFERYALDSPTAQDLLIAHAS